jgi:anti-sigma regulatory factor (Ser/Thr protein kinase)
VKTAQTFPPDANSIPAARRFVLAAVGAMAARPRDAVAVMVSELAMNAVEHARTRFRVTVELTGRLLRVEVTDSGGGTPAAQPQPDATSLRGRGLFLLDQLCDAWGTRSSAGSATTVWFTLALGPAPESAAGQSASTEPGSWSAGGARPPLSRIYSSSE